MGLKNPFQMELKGKRTDSGWLQKQEKSFSSNMGLNCRSKIPFHQDPFQTQAKY